MTSPRSASKARMHVIIMLYLRRQRVCSARVVAARAAEAHSGLYVAQIIATTVGKEGAATAAVRFAEADEDILLYLYSFSHSLMLWMPCA